jgi:c-di-GMP-binding flagellar brake protein YcgR
MNGIGRQSERRKWARLPLAIPIFVRSQDDQGKESVEFATALNVSAGGMLVALRRALPAVTSVRLEIPSAPEASLAPLITTTRKLLAKTLRSTPADGCYLLGLKFARPLSDGSRAGRKKVLSNV